MWRTRALLQHFLLANTVRRLLIVEKLEYRLVEPPGHATLHNVLKGRAMWETMWRLHSSQGRHELHLQWPRVLHPLNKADAASHGDNLVRANLQAALG